MSCQLSLDVGFCFYEDSLQTVKRAIDSVKDHVRYIFAVDGKFEFFESDQELSSDTVRSYLAKIPNVIMVDHPNRKENEKRQQYLDLANEHQSDFLLILDADEFIADRTDWTEFYKELQELYNHSVLPKIFGVNMQMSDTEGFLPRLWRRPYLIEYLKTHNFWKYKTDGSIWKSTNDVKAVRNLFMRGNDKTRSKEYLAKSYEYQKKLMAYEKPYKQEYRKYAKSDGIPVYQSRLKGIPFA